MPVQNQRFPMTILESRLKDCMKSRCDVIGRVLTAEEMVEYTLWMEQNHKNIDLADMMQEISDVLIGGEVFDIITNSLFKEDNRYNRRNFEFLYNNTKEKFYFYERQDIVAGRMLRYFPAYWREDEYFEVCYVFSGELSLFFEDEVIVLGAGDVVIIPPQIKKAYTLLKDESYVYFFMIRKSTFSKVFWEQLTEQNLMSNFFNRALNGNSGICYMGFHTKKDAWMEELLCQIKGEYDNDKKYSSQLMNALMMGFFLYLLQEYEETVFVSKNSNFYWKPEFVNILDYMQQNYATVTLTELTKKFGYSQRQLIRIIQNNIGSNFSSWQTRMRMESAERMLQTGNVSIQMVAERVGYRNLSSFYRAFEKYFGCTPKEYVHK